MRCTGLGLGLVQAGGVYLASCEFVDHCLPATRHPPPGGDQGQQQYTQLDHPLTYYRQATDGLVTRSRSRDWRTTYSRAVSVLTSCEPTVIICWLCTPRVTWLVVASRCPRLELVVDLGVTLTQASTRPIMTVVDSVWYITWFAYP